MAAPASRRSRLSQEGSLSWQQVHVAVVALGQPASEEQVDLLVGLLERFCRENDDPRHSPHLRAAGQNADRLDALVALLGRADVRRHCADFRLLALRACKILARRSDVRLRCSQAVLDTLTPLLGGGKAGPAGPPLLRAQAVREASEAGNALSNLCYEQQNVRGLLKAGGVDKLLSMLSSGVGAGQPSDAGLVAALSDAHVNAAGALQTISFQPEGRAALLKGGAPAVVLAALRRSTEGSEGDEGGEGASSSGGGNGSADGGRLQQRLVGTLHNLSSSAEGMAAIRQAGGLPPIVRLIRRAGGKRGRDAEGVAAAAAGALQNLSLEAAARADLKADPAALPALVALLVGPDTQAAICAAGTLANLMLEGEAPPAAAAPAGASSGSSAAGRQAVVDALSTCLAGAAIYHSLGGGAWPEVLDAAPAKG